MMSGCSSMLLMQRIWTPKQSESCENSKHTSKIFAATMILCAFSLPPWERLIFMTAIGDVFLATCGIRRETKTKSWGNNLFVTKHLSIKLQVVMIQMVSLVRMNRTINIAVYCGSNIRQLTVCFKWLRMCWQSPLTFECRTNIITTRRWQEIWLMNSMSNNPSPIRPWCVQSRQFPCGVFI